LRNARGFAEREGLQLHLVEDVSRANIRDRLAFHRFDVAHMLAPMTVASHLRLGYDERLSRIAFLAPSVSFGFLETES
jgi:ABC-type nitrate/sulfonate/bicarbonate transport system substrate-binding protein